MDGTVYADEHMLEEIRRTKACSRLLMPLIFRGLCKPFTGHCQTSIGDMGFHRGCGGVWAGRRRGFPGGVGYDINCGVRLLRTGLYRVEISGKLESVVNTLFANIPSGVGSHRKDLKTHNTK